MHGDAVSSNGCGCRAVHQRGKAHRTDPIAIADNIAVGPDVCIILSMASQTVDGGRVGGHIDRIRHRIGIKVGIGGVCNLPCALAFCAVSPTQCSRVDGNGIHLQAGRLLTRNCSDSNIIHNPRIIIIIIFRSTMENDPTICRNIWKINRFFLVVVIAYTTPVIIIKRCHQIPGREIIICDITHLQSRPTRIAKWVYPEVDSQAR